MKAFYGIDSTPVDKQINNAEWTKTPPPTTEWSNLLAVRVSLLVRSRNYVKPEASGASDAQFYTASNPVYTVSSGASAASTDCRVRDARPRGHDGHQSCRADQLALLPLSRLRARHPVAEHALVQQHPQLLS